VLLFSVLEKQRAADSRVLAAQTLYAFFERFADPKPLNTTVIRTDDSIGSPSIESFHQSTATTADRDGFGQTLFIQDPRLAAAVNLARFVTRYSWPPLQRAFADAAECCRHATSVSFVRKELCREH